MNTWKNSFQFFMFVFILPRTMQKIERRFATKQTPILFFLGLLFIINSNLIKAKRIINLYL
jgi:hypothetical protein